MAGFRLAQPELGSDIVVWGSIISVFLGGLSAGAFTGGRLADRRPSLWFLGGSWGHRRAARRAHALVLGRGVRASSPPARGMSVEVMAGAARKAQQIAV